MLRWTTGEGESGAMPPPAPRAAAGGATLSDHARVNSVRVGWNSMGLGCRCRACLLRGASGAKGPWSNLVKRSRAEPCDSTRSERWETRGRGAWTEPSRRAAHCCRLFYTLQAMEKNPWYKQVEGPFLQWKGPVGIKADGGGCTRARGRVGSMALHRAANNRDKEGEAWRQGRGECPAPWRLCSGRWAPSCAGGSGAWELCQGSEPPAQPPAPPRRPRFRFLPSCSHC